MAIDTRGGPYKFDFLETIVGINFPASGGYMVVEVTATKTMIGSAANCPQVRLLLGAKEQLLDVKADCKKVFTPGGTTSSTRWYVWNPMATFPTASTFDDVIAADYGVTYGTQLAKLVNMGNGYLLIGAYGTQLAGTPGVWATQSEAQAYATLWNDRFQDGVGGFPYPQMMFNDSFHVITQVGPAAPVVNVYNLTTSITTPPSTKATFVGLYLVKVPRALTTLRVQTAGADGNATIRVFGYHGRPPPKIANVNPAGYDTQASGTSNNPVTSRVDKTGPQGADFTTVTATGGGSGGGGGS